MTSTHVGLTKGQHRKIKRIKENANSKFIPTIAFMLHELGIETDADAVAYGIKHEHEIQAFDVKRGGK